MKKLISCFVALFLLCGISLAEAMDFSYSFDRNILTLYGTHPEGAGSQVTMLVNEAGADMEDDANWVVPIIKGIDQVATGVNGGFIIRANLGIIDEPVDIQVGGSGNVTASKSQIHLTSTPLTVADVGDNSVRIGNDVYEINSPHLTPDNIANSIKSGGNIMALKIGGLWYDLLDERADSSIYLEPKNAISQVTVNDWTLSKWYLMGSIYPINFTN